MRSETATALQTPSPTQDEAAAFAEEQGLRYVSDTQPGFRREPGRKNFAYFDPAGKRVTDEKLLARFKALVIPPAWTDVWICRYGNGHLQVTGRDARGRKQYRYHADWCSRRNETKFGKMLAFGRALPPLRTQVEEHLSLRGMPRDKVLAAIVVVLEQTRIRVGNDVYTKENKSFGLTTIRNKHAKVRGARVRFQFRGKSGVMRDVSLTDRRLSRIIRNCQELPGEELFCYQDDDGITHDIGSSDVNEYLKRVSGESITAKDFRTWGGTIKALELLAALGPLESETQRARKSRELEIIKNVAAYLGNTVSVCRKYYVSPSVFEADRDGSLHKLSGKTKAAKTSVYSPHESLLLKLLEK